MNFVTFGLNLYNDAYIMGLNDSDRDYSYISSFKERDYCILFSSNLLASYHPMKILSKLCVAS